MAIRKRENKSGTKQATSKRSTPWGAVRGTGKIKVHSDYARALQASKGISIQSAVGVAEQLHMSQIMVHDILGISDKTFRKYVKENIVVSGVDADLFLILSQLAEEGKETFKDDEKFNTWLNMEWEALNYKKPSEFLFTVSGAKHIIDLLINIRHGIYA